MVKYLGILVIIIFILSGLEWLNVIFIPYFERPEPSSIYLLGVGIVALAAFSRRNNKNDTKR